MRLNAQTDFSLRMLIYLATKGEGGATIQEISTRMKLSQTHMMRVAAKLAANGLVTSTRGRLGGLSLGRHAGEITVLDVVLAMEPDFALVECFDKSRGGCSIESACLLKGVLSSALEAFFAELRGVTLLQITQPARVQLIQVLGLGESEDRRAAAGGAR